MNLIEYDSTVRAEGFPILCGVDEAGRGPLAGPVVAAAVILPDGLEIGVNDSKKLSEKKRDALYQEIVEQAKAWGIGSASWTEIDEINILQATYLAMQRAVEQIKEKLGKAPSLVLVDGNRDPKLNLPTRLIVKGDGLSASIAAASILAKVTRDRIMLEYAQEYPEYLFAKHKGYPTKDHYSALEQYGPCPIHRRSFLKKLIREG